MTREQIGLASETQISNAIKEMDVQGLSNKMHVVVLGDTTDEVANTFLLAINQSTEGDQFYVAIVTVEGLQGFFQEAVSMTLPSLETVKDASMGETHIIILGDGGVTHYSVFKNTMVN